ncbi:serine palmitoyltransferase small subunit A-B-like [Tropilaelaps mercedesae]|uniref:Serine palmitoyltransferase small subunit A-B-like n=1 Tax=Tropilaelaps mercedesae TaxID=418985 RepID=A0A1V9X002_9ACAR|nr:serine palmitoyltransferase small subunit A-B-like [Tropilaelaps mercedesae]
MNKCQTMITGKPDEEILSSSINLAQMTETAKRQKPEYFDNSIKGRLKWLYLQWELLTAIYMLEPWEKHVFNVVAVSTVAILFYILVVMLPRIIGLLNASS